MSGFPVVCEDYAKILYNKCLFRLKRYLNRKGNFSNFNEDIILKYKDITKFINITDDFPVEEIDITFRVNLYKSEKKISNIGYTYLLSNKDNSESYIIKSKSGYKKAIHTSIEVGLSIPNYTKSLNLDELKKYIKEAINHELLHCYQDYKTNIIDPLIYPVTILFKLLKNMNYTSAYLYCIMAMTKPEIHARVAEGSTKIIETLEWCVNYKKVHKLIRKELDKNNISGTSLLRISIEYYIDNCKKHKIKPDKKIVALKNKILIDFLMFFSPWIEKRMIYFKKKLNKRLYLLEYS